ncbi:MAG: VOC family protein [Thermodesulfobacteriota bacterium]
MAPTYQFYHLHVVSRDPQATAQFYRRMFDAKVIETIQTDGKPRIDVDLSGLPIYIYRAAPQEDLPSCPPGRYLGLDHFALLVKNLDEAVADLRKRGAEFTTEPVTLRPGLRIAFIRGPENSRIEIAEHS